MKQTKSQYEQVEKWLLKGLKITPIQALEKFGCFRLGAIIWELKTTFYREHIKSKLIKVPTKCGRGYAYVAQYWLEE
jgi:hypothetical protein